jgi:hypothetical protein
MSDVFTMRSALFFFLSAATVFAAEDAWDKVSKLKSGAEVRIFKRGTPQPLLGKLDEVTDDNVVVALKNEQVAIPKDQIERIDYRTAHTGGKIVKDTKTTVSGPDAKAASRPQEGSGTQSTSTSTNLSIRSKPDFETIYRRTSTAPRK